MTNDTQAGAKPSDEILVMLDYIDWHQRMDKLSNEDLCRELLRTAPVWGRFGELSDLVIERLCPGLMDKIADEQAALAAQSGE